jgi:hypothetical protein
MADRIDVGSYDKQFLADVSTTLGLAAALKPAAPKKAPPWVLATYKAMVAQTDALKKEWKKVKDIPGIDLRIVDGRVDAAWLNFFERLFPFTRLDAQRFPRAKTGAALFKLLFPDGGRGFLNFAYASEWAESEKRIEQLKECKHVGDLEACVGADFWKELLEAHAAYGDALGLTKQVEAPEATKLGEKLVELRAAIAHYGSTVAVWGNSNEKNLKPALKALAPIDKARAEHAPGKPAAKPEPGQPGPGPT